jgi:hypothetical protein
LILKEKQKEVHINRKFWKFMMNKMFGSFIGYFFVPILRKNDFHLVFINFIEIHCTEGEKFFI